VSAAKNLVCRDSIEQQILRCAQDDSSFGQAKVFLSNARIVRSVLLDRVLRQVCSSGAKQEGRLFGRPSAVSEIL
jgi:hypothetical protein